MKNGERKRGEREREREEEAESEHNSKVVKPTHLARHVVETQVICFPISLILSMNLCNNNIGHGWNK